MSTYIGAIDQGTTSTRFIVFDRAGRIVSVAQKEHEQIYPQPGWVEHDASEIWRRTEEVIEAAMKQKGLRPGTWRRSALPTSARRRCSGTGRRGSRFTTHWSGRTPGSTPMWPNWSAHGGPDRLRAKTGLPLATYFSGLKIRWVLDNVPGVRERAEAGEILFGNIDSYLLWNLTGGPRGGIHLTDCTNASRTQLMNLETLDWDDELLEVIGVPRQILPENRGQQRGVWQRHSRFAEGRADRRNPGRSAGRSCGADLLSIRAKRRILMARDVFC